MRYVELISVEATQIERKPALRPIEGTRAAQQDILKIHRISAAERFFERLIRAKIDQANTRLQHSLCIGPRFVCVESFIAIVDLGRCLHESIISGLLYSQSHRAQSSTAGSRS